MIVHQIYAMIYEEEVKNVFVCDNYEMANYLARATYGDEAYSVDCLQYPCVVGDKYINNTFYKVDGITPVEYIPTQEQQVQKLGEENTDLQLALTEQYEENLSLHQELTNTQLALTELYEGLGV